MSRENVEIVRAAIEAFNRGDMGGVLKDAAASFEYDFSRSVGPQRGVYSLAQMDGFLYEFAEVWESIRFEAAEFIEAGEHVVTPTTSDHRGREGIEVQARAALVWTIRDGSIARISFYQERREALEAVGLRE
jgi:ketosteroid isomerase-like protein